MPRLLLLLLLPVVAAVPAFAAPFAYITNDDATVSVIDVPAGAVVATIDVGAASCTHPRGVAVSPSGLQVYVSCIGGTSQLAVIDTVTNAVKTWIPMAGVGYGSAPTPDGKWLLVALPDVNKVAVIDLATMKVARNIDVAAYPQAIAVNPDGKTAYASCMHADKVAEMDLASGKTTREFATGKQTDGLAWAPGR